MNIVLDIKKLLNDNEKKQLISTKMIIVHKKNSIECKGFFKDSNIKIETGINFIENEKYDVIISIVILGKQVYKGKMSFVYKKNSEQLIKDELIDFKITKNTSNNKINQITNLNYKTYKNYNFKINPLAILRKEDENTVTIFFNDNVYILRGNLMKIVYEIYCNNKFEEDIDKYEKIKDIQALILKGCIVCYE